MLISKIYFVKFYSLNVDLSYIFEYEWLQMFIERISREYKELEICNAKQNENFRMYLRVPFQLK